MATVSVDSPEVVVSEPNPFVMGRRLGAIIADSIVVGILTHFILVGVPTFHVRVQLPQSGDGGVNFAFASVESVLFGAGIGAVLYVLYFMAFEMLTATTPGKILAGLRVVDRYGGRVSPWQALVRNLLRPIDALGAYILGGFIAAVSSRRQRIGDHAAGTMVASVESLSDPARGMGRQAGRIMVILAALLAVALLADALSALISPPMVVAPYESFYPVNGTVTSNGTPPARSLRSARVRLVSHSPAHARYAIDLRLIDLKGRTVSCNIQASFVWTDLMNGWQYRDMSSVCNTAHRR